jgi:release factor glutamine methyltransferase
VKTEVLSWTPSSLLAWAGAYLQKYGVGSPRLSAELILGKVLNKTRLELYLHYDQPLRREELARFKDLLIRRRRHEPVAYLTGVREFYSLELRVGPGVLIPRPESELLVDEGIKILNQRQNGRILDLCTGSGALALALAAHLPRAEVWATDLSPQALEYARGNAEKLGLGRIIFRQGDLWRPLRETKLCFDLIIANPPYVSLREWQTLSCEVKDYEPRLALLGGDDGLDLVREILHGAEAFLGPGATLLLEISPQQADKARSEAQAAGFYRETALLPDLAGHCRVLRCIRRDNGSTDN